MTIKMTRIQLYLILILFAMFAFLLQTGIPYSWRSRHRNNSPELELNKIKDSIESNQQNLDKVGNEIKAGKQAFDKKKLIYSKSIMQLPFLKDIDSYPPWSYDRFMANMTLMIKQKRNQKELHSILSSAFNPLNSLPRIPDANVSKILLFAYFRSGSTFLGDLLQQNWKSFYTFEPLHYMSDGVRIDDNRIGEAVNLIEKLFRCDFNSIIKYVDWVKKTRNQFLFKWNKFLWGICRFRSMSCFDPTFISQTCQRARVHVMKVARLQMRHLETLLPQINQLNVNVVYLVRDPRGTLKSRQSMIWCSHQSNCSDISSLCSEMRNDLYWFKQFKALYSSKFTLIRYEDIATDPTTNTKLLFNKFNIPFSASVKRYLRTHTNSTISTFSKRNPYTTTRNSKSVAYEWKHTLNKTDILQVENICGDLLREFGYEFIGNNTSKIKISNN